MYIYVCMYLYICISQQGVGYLQHGYVLCGVGRCREANQSAARAFGLGFIQSAAHGFHPRSHQALSTSKRYI
jgi:hypothetical protein